MKFLPSLPSGPGPRDEIGDPWLSPREYQRTVLQRLTGAELDRHYRALVRDWTVTSEKDFDLLDQIVLAEQEYADRGRLVDVVQIVMGVQNELSRG